VIYQAVAHPVGQAAEDALGSRGHLLVVPGRLREITRSPPDGPV
jgi:hypothetical protein